MTGLTQSSTQTNSFNEPYISQTDEAELARLQAMVPGVGEPIFEDPEVTGFLEELTGLNYDDNGR